ncbi:hypothetical protein [Streptomyces sp. NRRL S-920]|uniref:hypothetical protein n=1 Tax=Streptomyces sp. NRRL S-920 TaxID=1463921 RepID=UPI0004C817D0|nr:hypothetical protein [Streptomyces sp. NRRL S-920]
MKHHGLLLQLLRAGRGAMFSAEAGRLRFWGIFLASGLLALAFSGFALAQGTYEGRDMRGAARAPQLLQGTESGAAVALWAWGSDDIDGRQHTVVYLEPLSKDAPLPPGLSRWPAPGQAVLSPALLEAGQHEGIRSRYGKLAGTITREGLQAPAERFAYVRPRAKLLDRQQMYPIRAFGMPSGGMTALGESMSLPKLSVFAAGLAGFALLPAAALVVASVRTGSAARTRRLALFEALGASSVSRAVFTVGEVAVPAALGSAAALAALIPTFLTDVPFPLVDFTLSATDARRMAPWLVGAGLAALILVLAASVLFHPRRPRQNATTRPASRFQRQRAWLPWMFPFAMLIAARGSELASDDLRLPVYALGVVGVLITLPAVIAAVTGSAGGWIAHLGSRLGRPGMLIAGRRMAAQTRVTARFVASLVIMIGLVAQSQLWTGLLSENAANAMTTQDRIGTSLLSISPYAENPRRVKEFSDSLPKDVALLLVRQALPGKAGPGAVTLTGSCAGLQTVHLPCGKQHDGPNPQPRDPRVTEFLRWTLGGTDVEVHSEIGDVAGAKAKIDESLSLIALSRSGRNLSLPDLREKARTHLGMRATAEPLGNGWLLGATDLTTSASWVRLLGLLGACLTTLAIGFSVLAEFLRFGRELAPLTVLTAGSRVYGSVLGWSLLFPALLAAVAGSVISLWLTAPITVGGRQPVADSLYLALAAGAGASSVLLCVGGWHVASRAAHRWKPAVG